jgi:hypothetical protein
MMQMAETIQIAGVDWKKLAVTLKLYVECTSRNIFEVVNYNDAALLSGGTAEGYLHYHEKPCFLHLLNADCAVIDVAG